MRAREFVAEVPLMAGLREDELQRVCDGMDVAWVAASKQIITQGDEGDCFYLILHGSAEVWRRETEHGALVKVGEVTAGGYFGERALLR